MTDFIPGFSFPSEFKYDLPSQIPPGLRQVQLRQLAYTNIPDPTPPGTEIIIQIPQLDYSFLDPSTTSITIKGTFKFQYFQINAAAPNVGANTTTVPSGQQLTVGAGAPNNVVIGRQVQMDAYNPNAVNRNARVFAAGNIIGYPPVSMLAQNPAHMLGKGWGMFRRYQVYANNNTLTDDIEQIGLLHCYMNNLVSDSAYNAGDWASGGNAANEAGSNVSFTFPTGPTLMSGGTTQTATGSTIASEGIAASKGWSSIGDPTVNNNTTNAPACFLAPFASNAIPSAYANGLATIPFEISLPLMGMLGSGNDKMFPLFLGPTRISLFTESLANYIQNPLSLLQLQAYGTNADGQYAYAFMNTSINLAHPNTQVTISSAEFVGNYVRCDGVAFQQIMSQLPVPGKLILRTTSFAYSSQPVPTGTAGTNDFLIATRRASAKFLLTTYNRDGLVDKSYGSVCPFLTQGTCTTINGIQYPQQGVDFLNKPRDAFRQTLVSLNLAYSALSRPAISYTNWARLNTFSEKVANQDLFPANLTLLQNFNYLQLSVLNAAQNAILLSDQLYWYPIYTQPNNIFWNDACQENKSASSVNSTIYGTLEGQNIISCPARNNQWCHIIDTETFGRRGFLSGVSTLSGSFFYHAVMSQAQPVAGTLNFFLYHDCILVMDAQTKQITWKI